MRAMPGDAAARAGLLSIFLLSGAGGLVYQVVWSRTLTLVFGSTTQGVATVLAAFMGGLALGSWAASRVGDRIAAPLRAYGLLECGVAAAGLGVVLLAPVLDAVYRAVYPVAELSLPALTLVRFLLASAFLLPATTLMGATLPVLSAHLERRSGIEGHGASKLYTVNTLGAVLGAAAAGFWLLPAAGILGSTLAAAGSNLLAAAGAFLLARREGAAPRPGPPPAAPARVHEAPPAEPLGLEARAGAAAALAVSGAGALVLEVAWTRTLSLVLGSSTHAFTVMLATFLIGLALGSAAATRRLGRIRNPLAAFALCELGVGAAVYLGVFVFPELPYAFLALFRAAGAAPLWFQAGRFALAASVMLVPTALLGATFPLAVRCWRMGASEAARPVGKLYAANTLGAIAGSVAAGFLLIPHVGLRQTLIAGALVNLSIGAFLLAVQPSGRPAARYGIAGAVVLLLPALPLGAPPWNPLLMTSGVFQYASQYNESFRTRREFLDYHRSHKHLYYRDGPTTTVTVEKRPAARDGRVWLVLTVNGKVDASTTADMDTQVLLGHLPMLAAAEARRVMVVGWGSGVTAGAVLRHPEVAALRAVEIEPAVLEASRFFQEFNHDPFADPRLRIEINDARHALLVDRGTYDVIISEPSNPWLAGPSRLFTREFFLLARDRLAPSGILCQWLQLYGLDPDAYRALIRTLHGVFDHVAVFKGSRADTLVMASPAPIRFDLARMRARMAAPAVASDLARIGLEGPASLLARFRVGGAAVRAFAGEGPINTDDNALLEFAALRNLYRETDAANDRILAEAAASPLDLVDAAGLAPEEAGRFPILLARELLRAGLTRRAREALDRTAGPPAAGTAPLPPAAAAEAEALLGDIAEKDGDAGAARRSWEEALRLDPDCLPALLALGRRALEEGGDPPAAERSFRRAAERHPGSAEAKVGLGRALAALGRAPEAAGVLTEAAGLASDPAVAASARMHLGRACLAAGDAACAVRELGRYFREWRHVPKPAEVSVAAAVDLGRAHLVLGDERAALEHFRVASDLGGSLARWHQGQAEEARRRGDGAAVERHLREAVAWNPMNPATHRSLGDFLMTEGRWEEARRAWSELLDRAPDDRTALGGAVEALRRLGRIEEAAPLIKRLMDAEEDPARLDALREVYRRALPGPR
jgi:spermidine synthase